MHGATPFPLASLVSASREALSSVLDMVVGESRSQHLLCHFHALAPGKPPTYRNHPPPHAAAERLSNVGSMQAKEKLQQGARPDMYALRKRYSDWLVNLLIKCLFHNPHDRPTGERDRRRLERSGLLAGGSGCIAVGCGPND